MGQRRGTVLTADGARLQVVVEGAATRDADATVVLAHGWTLTHHSWDAVVPLLLGARPGLRVVRWDQREHGRSTAGRDGRPAAVPRLSADVARVLATCAPSGPLVLAGHSMGGMALMAWAGQHAAAFDERVLGTLLVSTAAGELASTHLRRSSRLLTSALSRAPQTWRLPRLPAAGARRNSWGPDVESAVILAHSRREGWVRTRSLGRWYPAMMEHDQVASLEVVSRHPVRVLVGEHDRITPPRYTDALASHLPGAVVEHVPRAGHMLPQEHPQLVADHLLALLPST